MIRLDKPVWPPPAFPSTLMMARGSFGAVPPRALILRSLLIVATPYQSTHPMFDKTSHRKTKSCLFEPYSQGKIDCSVLQCVAVCCTSASSTNPGVQCVLCFFVQPFFAQTNTTSIGFCWFESRCIWMNTQMYLNIHSHVFESLLYLSRIHTPTHMQTHTCTNMQTHSCTLINVSEVVLP